MIDWTTRRSRWSPARAWCRIVGHDWVLMYYKLTDEDILTCWRCGQRNLFTRDPDRDEWLTPFSLYLE